MSGNREPNMKKISDSNVHFIEISDFRDYKSKLSSTRVTCLVNTYLPGLSIKKVISSMETLIDYSQNTDLYNVLPYSDDLHKINIDNKLISDLNIIGIKYHPRLLSDNFLFESNRFQRFLEFVAEKGLAGFICTYPWSTKQLYKENTIFNLLDKIDNYNDNDFIFLHGFDIKMLEFSQLIRHKKNCWIDLSYTITKRKGLLHELTIIDLCLNLEQKILIGSDYPYQCPGDVIDFVKNKLANSLPEKKLELVLNENLINLCHKLKKNE